MLYKYIHSICIYMYTIYTYSYYYLPIYGTQGMSSYRNTGIRPNCIISAALKDVRPNPRGARLYIVFELK